MRLFFFLLFNISAFISNAQSNSISETERNDILFMREEEKLARDIYDSLYVLWMLKPFENIGYSEQNHMDQMRSLVNRFGLVDPVVISSDKPGVFQNTQLSRYYTELISIGTENVAEALRVGAKIEELDIKDLMDKSTQTQNMFILDVYENLRMASERHLRAFVRNLSMRNIHYDPVVLDKKLYNNIINE